MKFLTTRFKIRLYLLQNETYWRKKKELIKLQEHWIWQSLILNVLYLLKKIAERMQNSLQNCIYYSKIQPNNCYLLQTSIKAYFEPYRWKHFEPLQCTGTSSQYLWRMLKARKIWDWYIITVFPQIKSADIRKSSNFKSPKPWIMFLFYVLSFFKKGDIIQGGTLLKGGH